MKSNTEKNFIQQQDFYYKAEAVSVPLFLKWPFICVMYILFLWVPFVPIGLNIARLIFDKKHPECKRGGGVKALIAMVGAIVAFFAVMVVFGIVQGQRVEAVREAIDNKNYETAYKLLNESYEECDTDQGRELWFSYYSSREEYESAADIYLDYLSVSEDILICEKAIESLGTIYDELSDVDKWRYKEFKRTYESASEEVKREEASETESSEKETENKKDNETTKEEKVTEKQKEITKKEKETEKQKETTKKEKETEKQKETTKKEKETEKQKETTKKEKETEKQKETTKKEKETEKQKETTKKEKETEKQKEKTTKKKKTEENNKDITAKKSEDKQTTYISDEKKVDKSSDKYIRQWIEENVDEGVGRFKAWKFRRNVSEDDFYDVWFKCLKSKVNVYEEPKRSFAYTVKDYCDLYITLWDENADVGKLNNLADELKDMFYEYENPSDGIGIEISQQVDEMFYRIKTIINEGYDPIYVEPDNKYRDCAPDWVFEGSEELPYKVNVGDSTLNIRSGCGEEYDIIGSLENGTDIVVLECYQGWAYITGTFGVDGFAKGNDVTPLYGWVSREYIEAIPYSPI